MKAPRDASYDDHLGGALKDPTEAAAYIEAVMELDDPSALLVALRHVAKAHGMAKVARRANVGDTTLTTVHNVLHAVGLRHNGCSSSDANELRIDGGGGFRRGCRSTDRACNQSGNDAIGGQPSCDRYSRPT